jgi:hypothetical protein
VSLSLTVPCVMWSPEAQIEARPSQPLFPYAASQTSTRPLVGRHLRPVVRPATTYVRSGFVVVNVPK